MSISGDIEITIISGGKIDFYDKSKHMTKNMHNYVLSLVKFPLRRLVTSFFVSVCSSICWKEPKIIICLFESGCYNRPWWSIDCCNNSSWAIDCYYRPSWALYCCFSPFWAIGYYYRASWGAAFFDSLTILTASIPPQSVLVSTSLDRSAAAPSRGSHGLRETFHCRALPFTYIYGEPSPKV